MATSGIYIESKIDDLHLTGLVALAEAAVMNHQDGGCRFDAAWRDRITARLKAKLPDLMGEILEAEEVFCPHRGIGMKEAA